MLANQASSTAPTTAASSDQMMQDGVGRLWTSLGQSPGLQMAWRRLPVFRSDMERRSAVVSLIVADRSHPTGLRSLADVTFIHDRVPFASFDIGHPAAEHVGKALFACPSAACPAR